MSGLNPLRDTNVILDHFTNGTENTVTGQYIGLEIETDFVEEATGNPITAETSQAIMAEVANHHGDFRILPELGRQKIELAINPQEGIDRLLTIAHDALALLYSTARKHGARPMYDQSFRDDDQLLMITEERDELWTEIDGREALEALCRCSSVQFTVDLNPNDAIEVINKLWAAKLHQLDYDLNNKLWRKYIESSNYGYRSDRYGGPEGFKDLADYVEQLYKQPVTMHKGESVRLDPRTVPDLDIELFLRSVWWHYRLRRYGNALTVEVRPFTRRPDGCFEFYWSKVAPIFGLDYRPSHRLRLPPRPKRQPSLSLTH
jgi:hypothetical protein